MKAKYPGRIFSNKDEDPNILFEINQLFLHRRGYISRIPKNEDVVFIISGGLDSSISLDLVIKEWGVNVYPLFVRRNARATKFEEISAKYFVSYFKNKYPEHMQSLEIVETEVPPIQFKKYPEIDRLQKLGHPMRNVVLQSLGVQYAQKLRAVSSPKLHTVLTSTVGDDSFPHSSLQALRSTNLSVCIDTGDWEWLVTSPLIDTEYDNRPIFKRDLIKYAVKRGIPMDKTRTCIEAGDVPDGTCSECLCRLRAFKEAGVKDPLKYQFNKK